MIGTVRYLCKQADHIGNLECDNILEPLTVRLYELQQDFNSFAHILNNRFQRSWFGVVGTTFKHLFGTLDEDDALKYNEAINSLQNTEKKLAFIVKENIIVTNSSLNSYKNILNKVKVNEDKLNHAIDELSTKLSNLSRISDTLTFENRIQSILNYLEASFLTMSFQLEDITNSILFCGLNKIHPSILSPAQLFRELIDNNRHLHSNVELPINLDLSTINYILNLSNVKCFSSNNKIMFILQIPLVNPQEFDLILFTPLPVFYKSNFNFIVPSTSYLGLSRNKQNYFNIDSLDQLKLIYKDSYICDTRTILITSTNPTCETELLSQVNSDLPKKCNIRTTSSPVDIWQSLPNNKWLFVQSNPCKVIIECTDSDQHELSVLGTGVLHTNCVAYACNVKLVPQGISTNFNYSTKKTNFNLLNLSNFINSTLSKNDKALESNQISLSNLNLNNLITNSKIYDELSQNTDSIINSSSFLKNEFHYNALFIVIVIILLFLLFHKMYNFIIRKRKRNFTIPVANSKLSTISISEAHVVEDASHPPSPEPLPRLRNIV